MVAEEVNLGTIFVFYFLVFLGIALGIAAAVYLVIYLMASAAKSKIQSVGQKYVEKGTRAATKFISTRMRSIRSTEHRTKRLRNS